MDPVLTLLHLPLSQMLTYLKDKIDGNSPSFGVVITVTCVLAPHYFLHFPLFLCALQPPVCVGMMAMLPLVGFTCSHRSLG